MSTNEDRRPLINDTLPRGSKKPYAKRRKSKKTAQATESDQTQAKPITKAKAKEPELNFEVAQEKLEEIARERKIIFEPNPGPQTEFLAASEQEVLYGGAAGGGKSFAMVADPVRYATNPNSNMLLLRRSTEELRELISVSKQLYPQAIPGSRFLERDKTWVFPSGATLWMSYLDRDDDVLRYQGQAYNWIGFDELTQWPTSYAWDYMRSRLRTAKNTGLPLCQRATTNPGGPGHFWVKKMFIDPAPYGQAFWALDENGNKMVWSEKSKFAQANGLVGKPMLKRKSDRDWETFS